MSENRGPNILRSLGAVMAGLLIIFVLSLGTDVVMHATGIFPPWFQPMAGPLWVFALAYRSVYAVLGSYVTARLAPNNPLKHVMLLGVIWGSPKHGRFGVHLECRTRVWTKVVSHCTRRKCAAVCVARRQTETKANGEIGEKGKGKNVES